MALPPTSSSTTKREFSHLRLLILLTTVLNTLDLRYNTRLITDHFQDDISYCPKCFKSQLNACQIFVEELSKDNDILMWQLLAVLPPSSCKRTNQVLTLKSTQDKVMAKYLANSKQHLSWSPNTEELKNLFLNDEHLNGIQYYPRERIEDFICAIQPFHDKLPVESFWLYMLVNGQPVLMPILYKLDFPVPKTYEICGFTLYQEYAGLDLYHLQQRDFVTTLNIAQQLLKASLMFSYGFKSFRLYITDLTADNMVYDINTNRLTFVDLDTIFIVDSRHAKYKSSTHRHEYIECSGCFAYSPNDITSYNVSDINIYATCQFLQEDLYRDATKGFLYPIPEFISRKYPMFKELLTRCVDCPQKTCWNRFNVAEDLINLFEIILQDFNRN